MSDTNKQPTEEPLEINEPYEEPELDVEVSVDASLEKAIEVYTKLREQKGPLTDQELAKLDKECDVIRNRDIITSDIDHEIQELQSDDKILMGPPNLTRFERQELWVHVHYNCH